MLMDVQMLVDSQQNDGRHADMQQNNCRYPLPTFYFYSGLWHVLECVETLVMKDICNRVHLVMHRNDGM